MDYVKDKHSVASSNGTAKMDIDAIMKALGCGEQDQGCTFSSAPEKEDNKEEKLDEDDTSRLLAALVLKGKSFGKGGGYGPHGPGKGDPNGKGNAQWIPGSWGNQGKGSRGDWGEGGDLGKGWDP
jgi:hypothetical protein